MIDSKGRQPFDRPIFIVSPPRSGSSLLFQTLAQAPGVFTIGGESHGLIETLPGLHPRTRGWTSNRLDRDDADPQRAEALAASFFAALRDRNGQAPQTAPVRMIEKTPKNSLRIPFFRAIFPDARFVYLYRNPRETIASMMEAWSSGRFRTYPLLPDWPGPPWSLLLTPEWRALAGRPLAEIAARQWTATTDILLDALDEVPDDAVVSISYAAFTTRPQQEIARLCIALGLDWDRTLGSTLPHSPTVVTAPNPDKWRKHAEEIERLWPIVGDAAARALRRLQR
jgi:hypothetical protein